MPDPKTIEYIRASLANGRTKEDLYKEFLGLGLSLEVIEQSFLEAVTANEAKEDTQKRTVRIVLTIAVLLIGAGIFSFIAANWQVMGKPLKLMVIIGSMLTSYIAGWYIKTNKQMEKTGMALILLGAIIYGSGIFLVAQMFNIRANWPDGFILWMFGVLALAYALDSYGLYYLAIPLGIISIIGHPFGMFDAFAHNPFLLTSSILLLVATIVCFFVGWSVRRKVPPEFNDYY